MAEGACMAGDMHGRGMGVGGMHCRGHAWPGGAWPGVCVARGVVHSNRDGHCRARCTSYWNAFLYIELVII